MDDNTDYSKLRVKELKNILAERGVECTGCIEKDDFVKKCKVRQRKKGEEQRWRGLGWGVGGG